ncbi:MAG: hypothetical protein V2I47_07645 [Bacteroidales bacterium]|jgi:hypothetical protein|nr:hypothetical protein [Bacteroidales bacterium]
MAHSFHIPVLGIGYSVDTPLKVAPLGINSVLSLVDDILLEKLRKMYCNQNSLPYKHISEKTHDFRAKRITAYLNLINILAKKKFKAIKSFSEADHDLLEYLMLLPENSGLEQEYRELRETTTDQSEIRSWLDERLKMGSIDVNIMTKVDKDNYKNGEKLAVEYNDAHAAVRGYALSDLDSSLILSAGINPRLYSYMQEFEDFYPLENGYIRKKIVLKVSDYKSAIIQGKFLAKKGLWVSEFRIESGLNCGGHAFATDGYLMGPILEEFSSKREILSRSIYEILLKALADKGKTIPRKPLALMLTAQGGVGTAEEHNFLMRHYGVDSVGWGTPFLLVPEASTVDEATLKQLADAREDDLYLSDISPLGIPFNTLKGNTKDLEKLKRIAAGKPGSSCSKKYAALSSEFSDKTICTASRHYQALKLKELSKASLSAEEYLDNYNKIVGKSCICVGLGTSCLLANKLEHKIEGDGVSVCPGPNLAYFSRAMSLKDITNHIYGRANLILRKDRPHMFIKELGIYIDFLKDKIKETDFEENVKQRDYLLRFGRNLEEGIAYYRELFTNAKAYFRLGKLDIFRKLDEYQQRLQLELQKVKQSGLLQEAD